jgi:hypothetical protein
MIPSRAVGLDPQHRYRSIAALQRSGQTTQLRRQYRGHDRAVAMKGNQARARDFSRRPQARLADGPGSIATIIQPSD